MKSPIQPTIGRVVLVRLPHEGGIAPALVNGMAEGSDTIDCFCTPRGQSGYPLIDVQYSEEELMGAGWTWHWMPYQVAKAAESA